VGQITNPIVKGITVLPTDRESGPGAGAGATGNNSIFLGLNAGLNSAVNNIVVLGNNSLSGGLTDVGLAGTTIVGQGNATALTGEDLAAGPVTIFGQNILPFKQFSNGSVMIGANIMDSAVSPGLGGVDNSVLIGDNIATANMLRINTSIGIGNGVFDPGFAGSAISDIIAIGVNAMALASTAGEIVAIGSGAGGAITSGLRNVLIGFSTVVPAAANDDTVIGCNATIGSSAVQSIAIGSAVSCQNNRSIVIGNGAVSNGVAANDDQVLIETRIGVNHVTAFFCQMATNAGATPCGNTILGFDTARNLGGAPGTNMIKIPNGTAAGGAAITGGGYFYVSAGTLHWVDSGGNDTQLSNPTTGQVGESFAALTNNAAAQIATLTNGPLAGNPTKWAPFNDNGTIRNIPMW
jgi:hypothetical protein